MLRDYYANTKHLHTRQYLFLPIEKRETFYNWKRMDRREICTRD